MKKEEIAKLNFLRNLNKVCPLDSKHSLELSELEKKNKQEMGVMKNG